jgi:hypothetical protein
MYLYHTNTGKFLEILSKISNIRGVNTNKCGSINKMTTIRARRMFIS